LSDWFWCFERGNLRYLRRRFTDFRSNFNVSLMKSALQV
jgi:hypothetical protein